MNEDLEQVKKLKNGQHYTVPESDYGKAEIWKINNVYFVFEIPQYGGTLMYSDHFSTPEEAIEKVESWT